MISQLHQHGLDPKLSWRIFAKRLRQQYTDASSSHLLCAVNREAAPADQERTISASGAQLGKCGKCINCKQTGRKKDCKLLKCQAAATAGNASAKLAMLQEDAIGRPSR